jgi:hypothetical protein
MAPLLDATYFLITDIILEFNKNGQKKYCRLKPRKSYQLRYPRKSEEIESKSRGKFDFRICWVLVSDDCSSYVRCYYWA